MIEYRDLIQEIENPVEVGEIIKHSDLEVKRIVDFIRRIGGEVLAIHPCYVEYKPLESFHISKGAKIFLGFMDGIKRLIGK